jgi:hypothetical protein
MRLRTFSMRAKITGEGGVGVPRLSRDASGTSASSTPTRRHARGWPRSSVITSGNSSDPITSRKMPPRSVSPAAGNDACAQKRASTREVARTWSESPFTSWAVNTNAPTASRPAPK